MMWRNFYLLLALSALFSGAVLKAQSKSPLNMSDYQANIISLTNKMIPATRQGPNYTFSVSEWKKGLLVSLGGTQTFLSNWAAGGQSSVAVGSLLSGYWNYRKNHISVDNEVTVGYGVLKQSNQKFAQKTDDRINVLSALNYAIDPYNGLTMMFNFRSQFTNGFSSADIHDTTTLISSFLAPGYFFLSLGWTYKPLKSVILFGAPISGRFTTVANNFLSEEGRYGVQAGRKLRSELGFLFRAAWEKSNFTYGVAKNVSVKSVLELYINYLSSRQGFVFNFENGFSFKVNDFINCTFTLHFIFDQAIILPDKDKALLQTKQLLGLNLSYDLVRMYDKLSHKNVRGPLLKTP